MTTLNLNFRDYASTSDEYTHCVIDDDNKKHYYNLPDWMDSNHKEQFVLDWVPAVFDADVCHVNGSDIYLAGHPV